MLGSGRGYKEGIAAGEVPAEEPEKLLSLYSICCWNTRVCITSLLLDSDLQLYRYCAELNGPQLLLTASSAQGKWTYLYNGHPVLYLYMTFLGVVPCEDYDSQPHLVSALLLSKCRDFVVAILLCQKAERSTMPPSLEIPCTWRNLYQTHRMGTVADLGSQLAVRRNHQLGWGSKMPFDENVLIWYVATDLCFYHPNTSSQGREGQATKRSREMSNYMIYLLLIRPVIQMFCTRTDLFSLASDFLFWKAARDRSTQKKFLHRRFLTCRCNSLQLMHSDAHTLKLIWFPMHANSPKNSPKK